MSVGNLLFGFDCDVRLRNPDVAADGHHVGEVEVLGFLVTADENLDFRLLLDLPVHPLGEAFLGNPLAHHHKFPAFPDIDLDQVARGLGEGLVAPVEVKELGHGLRRGALPRLPGPARSAAAAAASPFRCVISGDVLEVSRTRRSGGGVQYR